MRSSFLSSRRWRTVGWITALLFAILFIYTAFQLYMAVMGGAA